MAYLMGKYQSPTTYALMDLSAEEVELIGRALRKLIDVYERLGAPLAESAPLTALNEVLERRYGDDDE